MTGQCMSASKHHHLSPILLTVEQSPSMIVEAAVATIVGSSWVGVVTAVGIIVVFIWVGLILRVVVLDRDATETRATIEVGFFRLNVFWKWRGAPLLNPKPAEFHFFYLQYVSLYSSIVMDGIFHRVALFFLLQDMCWLRYRAQEVTTLTKQIVHLYRRSMSHKSRVKIERQWWTLNRRSCGRRGSRRLDARVQRGT